MCVCVCARRGLWNVPYITQVYLIKGSVLRSKLSQVSLFLDQEMDSDMVFCRNIREQVSCWARDRARDRALNARACVCVCV